MVPKVFTDVSIAINFWNVQNRSVWLPFYLHRELNMILWTGQRVSFFTVSTGPSIVNTRSHPVPRCACSLQLNDKTPSNGLPLWPPTPHLHQCWYAASEPTGQSLLVWDYWLQESEAKRGGGELEMERSRLRESERTRVWQRNKKKGWQTAIVRGEDKKERWGKHKRGGLHPERQKSHKWEEEKSWRETKRD